MVDYGAVTSAEDSIYEKSTRFNNGGANRHNLPALSLNSVVENKN